MHSGNLGLQGLRDQRGPQGMAILLGIKVVEAFYDGTGGISDCLSSEIFSEIESENVKENSARAGINEVQRISEIGAMNVIDQRQASRINTSGPGGIIQESSLADCGFDDVPASIDLHAGPAKYEREHSLSLRTGLSERHESASSKEHESSRSLHGRKYHMLLVVDIGFIPLRCQRAKKHVGSGMFITRE